MIIFNDGDVRNTNTAGIRQTAAIAETTSSCKKRKPAFTKRKSKAERTFVYVTKHEAL